MARRKLPASVLAAMGLTAAATDCDAPTTQPCLSPPADTDAAPEPAPELGACLMVLPEPPTPPAPEPETKPVPAPKPDVPVGPCLRVVPEPPLQPCLSPIPDPLPPDAPTSTPRPPSEGEPRDAAVDKVLQGGVLPADVADALRKRRGA